MKKSFIAILLCILLTASLCPAVATAVETGVKLTPESFPKSIQKPTNFGVTPKILGTPLRDGRDLESFKFAFSYPEAIKFIYDNRNNRAGISSLDFGYEIDYKMSESGSWHHTSEWDGETLAPEPYHNTMTVSATEDHAAFVKAKELKDLPGSTGAMLNSNTLYFRVRCTVNYKIDKTKAFLISPWSETVTIGKNAQAAELKMEAPVLTEIALDEITSGNFKGKYRLAIKFQVQDSIRAIDNSAGSVYLCEEHRVNNGDWKAINANHEIDGIFYIMPEDIGTGAVIDIKAAKYEVRARYAYSFEKVANPSQWSAYSNLLSIGTPTFYKDASTWATPALQKANEYGLIPDILKGADMTKPINREEFAELAVILYEKVTGIKSQSTTTNPFTDTINPQILKAYSIGVTRGTSKTTFEPKTLIKREQLVVMLFNTIKAIKPDGDYSIQGVKDFTDQKDISSWAVNATKYMSKAGIVTGDAKGNFMPRATTTAQQATFYGMATKEQAISVAVRTYEKMDSIKATTSIPATTQAQTSTQTSTQTQTPAQTPTVKANDTESGLTGLWSTSESFGAAIDSFGNVVDYTHSGCWYRFGEDGSFAKLNIFNKTGALLTGKYKVDGNKILVTGVKEGYVPGELQKAADRAYEFNIENTETAIRLVIENDIGIMERCYKTKVD